MQDLVLQTTLEVPAEKLILDQSKGSSLLMLDNDRFRASGQPPLDLLVTAISSTGNEVELAWTQPAFGVWDDYTVYAYNTQTQEVEQKIEGIILEQATVFGLANTIEYEFWIVSVKEGLESYDSNHVLATPLDTTAPVSPVGVTIISSENEAIDLSWTANTEEDLAGYNLYVDDGTGYVKHNTSPIEGIPYKADGLVNGQSYDAYLTAIDIWGNESDPSTIVSATVTDTLAPAVPTGLSILSFTDTTITLDWEDNQEPDLAGYNVYKDGVKVASLIFSSDYQLTGLSPDTPYDMYVTAEDTAGNESSVSATVSQTTVDTAAPASPTGLSAVSAQNGQLDLAWNANSEGDLAGYNVYVDSGAGFVKHNGSFLTGLTYTIQGLVNGQTYPVYITAIDNLGNESDPSATITPTIQDTIAPSAPTGLQTTAFTDTTIDIGWVESPEEDVASYNVYVDGVQQATGILTPSYSITGLLEATSYDIYVTAVDTSGNESNTSATISQATQDLVPSAPTGLAAVAGETTMDLSWNANAETDLAGYNVYVDGVKDNTSLVATEAYTVSGLTEGASYNFKITAVDSGGNESAFSAVVTESTQTAQLSPPTNFSVAVLPDAPENVGVRITLTETPQNFSVTVLPDTPENVQVSVEEGTGEYYTDFSEYTIDEFPAGWTAVETFADTAATSWLVKSKGDATGGQALALTGEEAGFKYMLWDQPPEAVNMRVEGKFLAETLGGSTRLRALARASSDITSYFTELSGFGSYDRTLQRHVTGGTVNLADDGVSGFLSANVWYRMELECIGDAIKGRFWQDGQTKPAAWDFEVTNADISAAGKPGVSMVLENSTDTCWVDWFKITLL